MWWTDNEGVEDVAKNFLIMTLWYPFFFGTGIIYILFGALCLPYLYTIYGMSYFIDKINSRSKSRYEDRRKYWKSIPPISWIKIKYFTELRYLGKIYYDLNKEFKENMILYYLKRK